MSLLIKHIKQLVNVRTQSKLLRGKELSALPVIEDAWLRVEGDRIVDFGRMETLQASTADLENAIDATGRLVLPGWCDSHTHLVFAASREEEFVDKIKGLSYAEIAATGGGILHSARRLQEMSEDQLFHLAWQRLQEAAAQGTTSIEIKSGYGLSVEGELKMLRVIKKLKEKSRLTIKSTFLGAHAFPPLYKDNHTGYINQLIQEMLPVIAAEQLADYIDVFCENGFFSPEEMETICLAGRQYGLKPKLHVNQLNSIGGIEKGIALDAVSLDHLETLTATDLDWLCNKVPGRSWNGVCTLLPTAAFFLRMPFQPARQLVDGGAAIALATDFNPGSSPSSNMNLVIAMSCIQMKLLPEEALNAATINGAFAMDCQQETGSITVGKKADLLLTQPVPSLAYLPYAFGASHIDRVMVGGTWIDG